MLVTSFHSERRPGVTPGAASVTPDTALVACHCCMPGVILDAQLAICGSL